MSRYVQVAALGLTAQRARGRLMLEGSVECAGEPVDLRLPAGTLDAVEDFGFVQEGDAIRLVCGELDEALLCERLLPPLHAVVAEHRLHRAAEDAGLQIEQATEAEGQRRLVLRRKG